MFIKETKRRRRDGSEVVYLQLVISQWDPKRNASRQRVLHNLGRKDQVDRAALARVVQSFTRYLAQGDLKAAQEAAMAKVADAPTSSPEYDWDEIQAFDLGLPWLLRSIAQEQLGERSGADRELLALLYGRAARPGAPASQLSPLPWMAAAGGPDLGLERRLMELQAQDLRLWEPSPGSPLVLHLPQSCSWTGAPMDPWIALTLDAQGRRLHHQVWSRQPPEAPDPGTAKLLTWQRWEVLPTFLIAHTRRFLWQLSPQAHPDFEALLRQRGRYRKINQELSFRHSSVQLGGRRLLALLVRTRGGHASPEELEPWQRRHPWAAPGPEFQLLLTDDHQSDAEALILASEAAQHTSAELNRLRSGALARRAGRAGPGEQDLWLDLMALALVQAAQRRTRLGWEALQRQLGPLQALRHPQGHYQRLGWQPQMEECYQRAGCAPPPAQIHP